MKTYKGDFDIIIPKTSLLCSIIKQYETLYDNQTWLGNNLCEGERYMVKVNYYLNGYTIKGLKKALKGEVKFDMTMKLDEDGIFKINANKINGEYSKSIQKKY